jgi:hypothetical protein
MKGGTVKIRVVSSKLNWLIAAAFVYLGVAQICQAQNIDVTEARIGCLDIQKSGNLTTIVGKACNGKSSCSFKAPTQSEYEREGVKAATRTFCTQGMEIIYRCGTGPNQVISVPGDAWNNPPAQLECAAAAPQQPSQAHTITVTKARIGCLDIQLDGNLTPFVAEACNNRASCSYKAPTQADYEREGVKAATRTFCTQGMEITYRCGTGPNLVVSVPGDAWNNPPAQLHCLADDPSTYRTTDGYSFVNSDAFQTMVGGYNWDELKDLYGCQVEVSPFGWCTGIPDPLSLVYVLVLNASLQSGQCFGFSLSSLRFLNGQQSLNSFPRVVGPEDIWDLVGTGFTNGQNVSPNLSHFIHEEHILQTSANAIHLYITEGLSSHTHQGLMQEVTNALNAQGAVLCMQNGGNGHCIVPYAVEPQPNGDFTIENYNPNVPYAANENHASALAQSRITVHSANNTYQLGDGSEFSGGLTGIEVFPYSTFNSPAAPTSLTGLVDIVFGSIQGTGVKTTQITDSSGHQLLNADGSWNTNPATRIPDSAVLPVFGGKAVPGTMLLALARGGTYTHTIENHATGKYQLDLVGKDFGVQIHDIPSNAGDKETISYSPTNSHVSFSTTAANKPFDMQVLVRQADKSVRTAHVTGNAKQNMHLEMGFDATKQTFTFQHQGNPGQVVIHLGYTLQNSSSEVTLAPVAVQHGDTVTLKPNWKDLKGASPGTLEIKSVNGAVQSRKLQ